LKTKENLTDKLKYIGLDLENIPDKLNFYGNVNIKIHKNYMEKSYKVYRYIDVNDIEIFLVPTNRLSDYTEKCAKALPLGAYLHTETDEETQRNIEFLNLIRELQIEDIEQIVKQQNQLNKRIPYKVQYDKDYLWQIYYSDVSKKYYMLAPIKETECTALFYIIKKQLENKPCKIYVPICYANYSNKYLIKQEIEELEKYLCYFTKEWPLTHEVYDNEEHLSLQVVGKTIIYDTIKSEYKIELQDQGEAEEFYKLLKALFILETQLSNYYKFNLKLDENGQIHFYKDEEEITYECLISFIKQEYITGLERSIKDKENKINLDKELKTLKALAKKLDEEYFEREKQISTFLECKKTFLGKIKYFFKYKKKKTEINDTESNEKVEPNKLKYCERLPVKEAYTLEELLELYSNIEQEENAIKDLELDIEALNKRIDILKIKLENAKFYIKEIDKHKKSIFEFWKFTNKDDAKQLNAGKTEQTKPKKLKKTFKYDLDFEDLSKQMDKTQREVLSKEETDNVYLITTEVICDINAVLNNKKIKEEHLEGLKQELEKEAQITDFDVFGSITGSKEKMRELGNIKHRENEKNKFAILNINKETTINEYQERIKGIAGSIQQSIEKQKNKIEIPIYKIGKIEKGLNVFYINPENALKHASKKEEKLHKVILSEGINYLPLTNIIYYNNVNKTLPLGMNVSDGILINTNNLELVKEDKTQNYVITMNSKNEPKALKLEIYNYSIKN